MLPRYFYWSLLVLICVFALWRGRRDERIVALACICASVASLLVLSTQTARYSRVEFGLLFVDLTTLAVFVAVALRSHRFWPLWIAGLQLTTSMAHILKALDLDLLPYAYGAAARFWSYPILVILFVGAWRAHRRPPTDLEGPLRA
ncbi:MAG TPA: hypothetical protein VKC17_05565 [Sphingomicrobium sp.]|nr:hypothetical protein [Sphingomicrobium sp.]